MVHLASVDAVNHFFITNKFVLAGYVLNENTATLLYHRTLPVASDDMEVDPNIFCLTDSKNDHTTVVEVYDVWEGETPCTVSAAVQGGNTNIKDIALDKTMYGIITCDIKPQFHEHKSHMVLN